MLDALLQRRPIIVVLAGPNGAGKSTFFNAHLATAGLRFVNADLLARELDLGPQQAMAVADALTTPLSCICMGAGSRSRPQHRPPLAPWPPSFWLSTRSTSALKR